ncbi:MAG TPA: hypothetical protein VMJ75_00865 [Candidatus Acidoferrales bacterium]|nr:hypothetical protein [Candidatus Acidoferrales bacterium]
MSPSTPKTVPQARGERCPRCLQPVEFHAKRCPNCGEPLSTHRGLSLWIGVGGLLALIFVVGLMWLVVRNDDLAKAPPLFDEQSQARKEQILADPPKENKENKDAKPDKPEKPPPLNQ